MRTKLFTVSALAALAVTASVFAATAGARTPGVRFSFLGIVTSTPANGSLSVTVDGGTRLALRTMLGRPVAQTFAYGANTEFLKWANGVPTVVAADALGAGDHVWIHVRAPRNATLAEIEQQPAGLVGDHGQTLTKPDKPLFLFRGRLTAVGSSSVSVHVTGGDHRALRLLIGRSPDLTFTTDGSTIYLLWQGKVPSVIAPSQLKVGDRITVRIRAEKGSTLAQIESAAAVKVAEHEPAGTA